MRVTAKGQVTIPAEIRDRAGLLPHTEVEFEFDGKVVRIVRAKAGKKGGRGARLVAHLRGRGDIAMSTGAIMALTRDDRMTAVLADAGVLLDVMTEDTRWFAWSAEAIERAADRHRLVINPVVCAEVSIRYSRIEELDAALPKTMFDREPIPYEAAFLAGKAFLVYRRRGNKERAASGFLHWCSRGRRGIFPDDEGCSALLYLFPQAPSDRPERNLHFKIGLRHRRSAHHRQIERSTRPDRAHGRLGKYVLHPIGRLFMGPAKQRANAGQRLLVQHRWCISCGEQAAPTDDCPPRCFFVRRVWPGARTW